MGVICLTDLLSIVVSDKSRSKISKKYLMDHDKSNSTTFNCRQLIELGRGRTRAYVLNLFNARAPPKAELRER